MWYKNIKAQNFLIVFFSLIGIVGSLYFVNLNPGLSVEEERQIETAVFSAFIKNISSHPDADPDYFFLGVSGKDPAPRVLNHFNQHSPKVEGLSNSSTDFGFSASVAHKSNADKKGIIVDLRLMDTKENGEVWVRSSVYEDRGSSATYEYILKKHDGIFKVISVKYPDRSEMIEMLSR
ncbi:MAG: hypothetical protein CL670_11885 [Balneola sp.]|nr:hypothetical protein [Balneola sp.]MBE79848.1 hypothetical protein [Balneola sp.]HBX65521.1 hypothetical protein [Balneolaceae bacterium]|tara:strand:- start:188 stop:721 length:534 start_codon:yes stop_codon:yes gene_type:complete